MLSWASSLLSYISTSAISQDPSGYIHQDWCNKGCGGQCNPAGQSSSSPVGVPPSPKQAEVLRDSLTEKERTYRKAQGYFLSEDLFPVHEANIQTEPIFIEETPRSPLTEEEKQMISQMFDVFAQGKEQFSLTDINTVFGGWVVKELPWQDIDKNKNGAIERDEWLLYWTKRCAQMQWTGPGGLKAYLEQFSKKVEENVSLKTSCSPPSKEVRKDPGMMKMHQELQESKADIEWLKKELAAARS